MGAAPPILPQPTGAPAGISSVVSQDDLTRWAQLAGVLQYFTETVPQPPAPTRAVPLAVTSANDTFTNLYAQLKSMGVPSIVAYIWAAFWASFLGVLGVLVGALTRFIAALLTPLASGVLLALDQLRKGIDPAVGILAQNVLSEFLGVDVSTTNISFNTSNAAHLERAQAIGQLIGSQLEGEFLKAAGGSVKPSVGPAQTFSGLAVNFGLASGILGLIGGMVPYGHWEELRELGEEVARNLGLGRLVRQALMPLVHILVAQPATWYYNTKYLPTQFREGDLVNPFTSTVLDHATLYNAMHLLGYSDDKIAAFIEMHQKRITPAQVALLVDNALWSAEDANKYLDRSGWPAGFGGTVLGLEELHEERAWFDKLISELEAEVKAGRLTMDEFTQVLNGTGVTATIPGAGPGGTPLPALQGLPYSTRVKSIIIATAQFKHDAMRAARPHQLSGGELFYAFAAGLITTADLTARWTAQGLSTDDQDIRLQLWLLHLGRLHELEQSKQTLYQEKQKAFIEKQAGQKAGPLVPIPPVPPFPLG